MRAGFARVDLSPFTCLLTCSTLTGCSGAWTSGHSQGLEGPISRWGHRAGEPTCSAPTGAVPSLGECLSWQVLKNQPNQPGVSGDSNSHIQTSIKAKHRSRETRLTGHLRPGQVRQSHTTGKIGKGVIFHKSDPFHLKLCHLGPPGGPGLNSIPPRAGPCRPTPRAELEFTGYRGPAQPHDY